MPSLHKSEGFSAGLILTVLNQSTDWSEKSESQRNANNHDHGSFNHLWKERWRRQEHVGTVCDVPQRCSQHQDRNASTIGYSRHQLRCLDLLQKVIVVCVSCWKRMIVENVGCSRSRADTALAAPQRRVTDHAPNSEHDKAPGGFSRLLRPIPLIKQCVRVRN